MLSVASDGHIASIFNQEPILKERIIFSLKKNLKILKE